MASGILKVTLALSHKLKLDRGCVKLNPLAAYDRKEPRLLTLCCPAGTRPSVDTSEQNTLWAPGSLGRGALAREY